MEEREEGEKSASEVGDPAGVAYFFDVFIPTNRKPLRGA